MITSGINFKNFNLTKKSNLVKKKIKLLLKENNAIIQSLQKNYRDSFSLKDIKKYKTLSNFRIIGMGGSSLGAQAIYDFLKSKIKKNFFFFNNLQSKINSNKKKKHLNLVISKSGNTIETILNSNIYIQKRDKNIFITENKKNYLNTLAKKLKSDVIHHNNFIGGRYSVLSEVGMLPAELMGLNPKNFRQLNNLIKNQRYMNALISNVSSISYFLTKKKFNSIILNYDEQSINFFSWYQQLVAESLGKKGKGFLPFISTMPKDNHSMMQFYLDGLKNNFFTFFYVKNKDIIKINSNDILSQNSFLKNKSLKDIKYAQKIATENVFKKKNIPYRSFEIAKRDEKSLGELFCFFILETILLGKIMKVNPYNQPSVELIKKETKKILI
tara:strand:+ start:430 stop:1584 length:1155 start_codon:yes stop_codon:yes gene_type:complete